MRCITAAATSTTTNVAAAWSMSNRACPNAVGASIVNSAPHAAIASAATAKTAAGADSSEANPIRQTSDNATMHATQTIKNVPARIVVACKLDRGASAKSTRPTDAGSNTRTVSWGIDAICFHSARKTV